MKSILQKEKECFICGTPFGLDHHHCIYGTANRKLADQDGLWVYLCEEHHTGSTGVHKNRELGLKLIQMAQKKYEETHTRDEFRIRYGKSWL